MKFDLKGLIDKFGRRYIIIITVLFALILGLLMSGSVKQTNKDLKEGKLAEETIRANKTIENKEETEERRKLAAEAVTPTYSFDDSIAKHRVELTTQLFTYIEDTKKELQEKYQRDLEKAKDRNSVEVPSTEDKIANLKGRLERIDSDDINFFQDISQSFYQDVFELPEDQFNLLKTEMITIVEKTMGERIRDNNLDQHRESAKDSIGVSALSEEGKNLAESLIDKVVVVNEVFDEKATAAAKEAAKEAVNPVMIYHGEVIVREGVQIDARAMKKLELLGMTSKNNTIFPYVAMIMLIVIQLILLIWLVMRETVKELQFRFINFYVFMMTLSILFMKSIALFQTESMPYISLLFPAAFTPLVLNLFISRKASVLSALFQVAFSVFVFYDLGGTSTLILLLMSYLFSGLMASLIKQERIGRQIGKALIWLIIIPLAFTIVISTYQGMDFWDSKTVSAILCMLLGSLFTFVLSIGLHPYIELLLNDDSMIVLNELSNPNHPLLKRLLEEAPGTYHHSMMVASLSSNAVAAIGGRTLITRVACYYHDIGKLKHANFFVENLPLGAENPHNFLLPEDSKEIIFSHVSEGVKILKSQKMPKMIVDICEQHHGTTLMSFFYVKAYERDDTVKEEDFRYPGPKPQTKEAAVVNLADTCEAAVRAMKQPTNDAINEFVHDLIEKRIKDNQLDESGLTLGEIRLIEKSLINGLCSAYHSRIEYPKMKKKIEESNK